MIPAETVIELYEDGLELEISPEEIRRILHWFQLLKRQRLMEEQDLFIARRLEAAYDILVQMRVGS
jgi:hypothetical protein